jgi:predicted acetyltransferase
MAVRVRPSRDIREFREGATCIGAYFNWHPSDEEATEFAKLLPLDRMHVALDGEAVVGGAGAFPLRFSMPGADPVAAAGVTVVGVQPTHRRQGILSRLMAAQLRDARERAEPLAVLWASEPTIYRRFGYGIATLMQRMRLPHGSAGLHGTRAPDVRARLVEHDEALKTFPRIYARSLGTTGGLIARTPEWWAARNLFDDARRRRGAGPQQRLLVERAGKPVGYALYRISQDTSGGKWTKQLRVAEAFGVDDAALVGVWRYLLATDWMDTFEAWFLPVDHALVVSLLNLHDAEMTTMDGVWVRPVDVRAALAARGYGEGRATIEVVSDPHFPDNVGLWRVENGGVARGKGRPDVRVDVAALGSALLGGFSFSQLARSGLAEGTPAGLARADALFRVERAPFCAEIF